MQHKRASPDGAENEQIAVAELRLLYRFLNAHGLERDGFGAIYDMWFNNRVASGNEWTLIDARALPAARADPVSSESGSTRALERATGGAIGSLSPLGRRLLIRRRSR